MIANRRMGLVFDLVACLLCGVAVLKGVRTTQDLNWPFDPDHFRDIAQAQTIQDGGWLQDPFYLGETTWYSPLLPATVAALSSTTGVSVPVVFTRAGAFLNAPAPAAFYLLCVSLVGRAAAVGSLVAFLFMGTAPSWSSATYSPTCSHVLTRPAGAYIIDVYTWRYHENSEGVQERQQPGRQDSEGVSPERRRGRNPEAGWLAVAPA
jgi:hypothetical protein